MWDYLLLGDVRLSACSLSPLNKPLVTFTQTMTAALTDRFQRFSAPIQLNRMLSEEYKSRSGAGRGMRRSKMLIYQDTGVMNGPRLGCLEDGTDFNSRSKHLDRASFLSFHWGIGGLVFWVLANSDYSLILHGTC